MTRRYFATDLPARGGKVFLSGTEAQHAIRVMRVNVGDKITLFDGKGCEAHAIVASVDRNECHCDAMPRQAVDRELSKTIHLGVALPKPDRARELIERLTELGVKTVTPLVASRIQRPPSDAVLAKLRRAVIEASKQCGRNELMEIAPVATASEFLQAGYDAYRMVAHPSGDPASFDVAKQAQHVVAAVGPEGGWTEDEVELAIAHGFSCADLGKRIYRVETAATVIASVLST